MGRRRRGGWGGRWSGSLAGSCLSATRHMLGVNLLLIGFPLRSRFAGRIALLDHLRGAYVAYNRAHASPRLQHL